MKTQKNNPIIFPGILFLMLYLTFSKSVLGQEAKKTYYAYQQEVDTYLNASELEKACETYLQMGKAYPILGTDVISMLQTSVKRKQYKAFKTAVKWMHNNTYEPIMEHIPIYLAEDSFLLKTDKQLAKILRDVTQTKPDFGHLDHESILFINGLIQSDYDDRMINPDTLSENKLFRITHTDSVRFVRFCDYVDRKGFPKWSSLGIYAGGMQTLLSHWTFLGMREYEKDSKLFQQKINLVKLAHQRVKEGEFDYGFYNSRIIGMTKWVLTKSNRQVEFVHFEPYTKF